MAGIGRVFRRGKKGIVWLAYYCHGKEIRESSRTTNEQLARKLLAQRIAEVGTGKLIGASETTVTFRDLWSLLVDDYAANKRRSAPCLRGRLGNLAPFFVDRRAIDITPSLIARYTRARIAEKAAPATINRELSALRRAFKLAERLGILSRSPYIGMLAEDNIREGFIEPYDFRKLRDALPEYLRDPVTFLYLSGWRSREMRTLEWRDVDLSSATVTLRRARSKNKQPRTLPLMGELREIIERARAARLAGCALVFHRDGKPLGDFQRRSWKRACAAAGLGKLIVHDLRRSAGRNMTQAGVPERVVMALMGHSTRAMFDRYQITNEQDLRVGIAKLGAWLNRPVAEVSEEQRA